MSKPWCEAVVIGASAGAVEALSAILPALPFDFCLPIIVVVHLPADKESIMVKLFEKKCKMRVKEVEDKESIEKGTIYFAPPDYHVLIEPDKCLSLSNEEPELFSRPSIDVLFESASDVYKDKLLGIILSGANNDGAQGLAAVIRRKGRGIIQHPRFSSVSYMPQAAIDACPEADIMTLEHITDYLQKACA